MQAMCRFLPTADTDYQLKGRLLALQCVETLFVITNGSSLLRSVLRHCLSSQTAAPCSAVCRDTVCHRKRQLLALQCVERLPGGGAGCTGRCDCSAGAGPSVHSIQLCTAVLQRLSRSADPQDCSWPVGTRADSSSQKPAGKPNRGIRTCS